MPRVSLENDAVAPDDFESTLELDRYGHRSTASDTIIFATYDYLRDPPDPKYIGFSDKPRQILIAAA